MATHTNALSLIRAQEARFKNVKLTIDNVTKIMAQMGRHDLVELTQGGIKSKELARMGHPYGRGVSAAQNLVNAGNSGKRPTVKRSHRVATRGKAPLRPINIQSGRLHGSIGINFAGRNKYDVTISAPYAKYIMHPAGTKYMVGRGVMGWRDLGYPNKGALEKRHMSRVKAYRNVVKAAQSKP